MGNYAREGLMVDLSDLWENGGSDIPEGISSVSQLDGTYHMYPLSVAHCMRLSTMMSLRRLVPPVYRRGNPHLDHRQLRKSHGGRS